jgi:nucleotide-binding universal stress UspA family protein
MTTLLAALNSNSSAKPVIRTAVDLAGLFDASVVALHVAEEGVSSLAPELARTAGVVLRETTGSPVEQIVAAMQDPDVAALVLGARGVPGGPQPAGHTALDVITRVPKPVVVVPPDFQPPRRVHRILVPIEGSPERSHALESTIELAHRRRLEVLALHVHSPETVPAFADHAPHAASAWGQEFLARYVSAPDHRIKLLRRLGVPAEDVLVVAHEVSADLIALSWKQDLGPGHARVVSETLAHSDIPVLLLPLGEHPTP